MPSLVANVQDAYGDLVEDCRTKRVNRMILGRSETRYMPHDPGIDLSHVPVFQHDMGTGFHGADLNAAIDAIGEGRFHMPYPLTAYISRIEGNSPSHHDGKYVKRMGRWYVIVVDENEHGSFWFGFVRHDDQPRWARQIWQLEITETQFRWAMEPGAAPEDLLDGLWKSTLGRINTVIIFVHKLGLTKGRVTSAVSGPISEKIGIRREKLHLDPVPRVRLLSFDPLPMTTETATGRGKGRPKAPHDRRGTWRNLPTGGQTWVRPSLIHGGSAAAPWYHLRDESHSPA